MMFPDGSIERFGLLADSYRHWSGEALVKAPARRADAARWAYREASFPLLAHGSQADPLFIYANLSAQRLFEYEWDEFIGTPSRFSAPQILRNERDRLVRYVDQQGIVEPYEGIRISRTGRLFWIDAVVWKLIDRSEESAGLAAMIRGTRPASLAQVHARADITHSADTGDLPCSQR